MGRPQGFRNIVDASKMTLEEELEGKKTGFEVLQETKLENIRRVKQMVRDNPVVTRSHICQELGVSKRSATRFLSIVRKSMKVTTGEDIQDLKRAAGFKRFKALLKQKPETTVMGRCAILGISGSTYRSYLKELRNELPKA